MRFHPPSKRSNTLSLPKDCGGAIFKKGKASLEKEASMDEKIYRRDTKSSDVEEDTITKALSIVMPLVFEFVEHSEARSLGVVCKEWLKAGALTDKVFPRLPTNSFVEAFCRTDLGDYNWDWLEDPFLIKSGSVGIPPEFLRLSHVGDDPLTVLSYRSVGDLSSLKCQLTLSREDFNYFEVDPHAADKASVGDCVLLHMDSSNFWIECFCAVQAKKLGICIDNAANLDQIADTFQNNTDKVVANAFSCTLIRIHDETLELSLEVLRDHYFIAKLMANPFQEEFLERVQNSPVREGVAWNDMGLSSELSKSLDRHMEDMADNYRSDSNSVVKEYIDPFLFSYVDGVTPLKNIKMQEHPPKFMPSDQRKDRFDRAYKESSFQWIPTDFLIHSSRNVNILGDIHGLRPRAAHESFYKDLSQLFGLFVPKLEAIYAYARYLKFPEDYVQYNNEDVLEEKDIQLVSMRIDTPQGNEMCDNTKSESVNFDTEMNTVSSIKNPPSSSFLNHVNYALLQVMTKIVDYDLDPGQSYEEDWHVVGMPHEHIVACCLCILKCDPNIVGGDLLFQRAWDIEETNVLQMHIAQKSDPVTHHCASTKPRPLGKVASTTGRMIVFSNTHVHKFAKMTNVGGTRARLRMIAFFVVDPEYRILSTAQVPDQRGTLTLEEAERYRLEHRTERRLYKQDWNIREILANTD